jgi:serine/threonine protein kinase
MRQIGPYDVETLIGDGGMGAVYRGRDSRFDRLVAIKVLHSRFQRDPGVVERFKAEAPSSRPGPATPTSWRSSISSRNPGGSPS